MLFQHQDLVEQLIDTRRTVADRGLTLASGGNLSARLPDSDRFLVTRGGAWLDRLSPRDISVLGPDGQVHSGSPRPSSEWKLHAYGYQARPDAGAIAHVYPQMAVLLDALGKQIRLLTLDHAYYVCALDRTHSLLPERLGGTGALCRRASRGPRLRHPGQSRLLDVRGRCQHGASSCAQSGRGRDPHLSSAHAGDTITTFPPEAFNALRHD